MRRTLAVTGSLAILIAVVWGVEAPTRAAASVVSAVPIVTGLDFPTGFTFAPDGRIFYGERFTGEVRIYDPYLIESCAEGFSADRITLGGESLIRTNGHGCRDQAAFVFIDDNGRGHNPY